jgi:hypothetical protein
VSTEEEIAVGGVAGFGDETVFALSDFQDEIEEVPETGPGVGAGDVESLSRA